MARRAEKRFVPNVIASATTGHSDAAQPPALRRVGNEISDQFRSARGHEHVFRDLWRRVEIFSEAKAPNETACAVEYVGGAFAPTGHIISLCTLAKDVNRNASSVNVRDSQWRIICWNITIAMCSVQANQRASGWTKDTEDSLFAGFESGIGICDLRVKGQSGRGGYGRNHEHP